MTRFKVTQGVITTSTKVLYVEAHDVEDANLKSEFASNGEWVTHIVSEEIISNDIISC